MLTDWGVAGGVDDAVLLTSELATNAVLHAGTGFDVECALLDGAVLIEVLDHYPTRTLPASPPDEVEDDSEGGRGLQLTAAVAATWGVEYSLSTKRVWFRIELPELRRPADERLQAAEVDWPAGERPRVAWVLLDGDGVVLEWDEAAHGLTGWPAEEAVGTALGDLLHPGAGARAADWRDAARWQGDYELRSPDGRSVPVFARHVRLRGGEDDKETVACLLAPAWLRVLLTDPAPTPPRGSPGESNGIPETETLGRLELPELLARTVGWGQAAVSGDGGFVLLVTDTQRELELRATSGLAPAVSGQRRLQVAEGITGRLSDLPLPRVLDDLDAESDGSDLGWLRDSGVRSVVSVPLVVEGGLIGVLGVTAAEPAQFTLDDGARLQKAADRVSIAVQTARLTEIERTRRGWLSYLAEASDMLAGTLELDRTLALVAQLVVPRLAPWCAVYLVDETATQSLVYTWHADEERLVTLGQLLAKVPAPPLGGRATPTPWSPLDDVSLDGLAQSAGLAAAGATVIPLIARGRQTGCLALGHAPGERPRSDQLELATDLSRRAAVSLDNARLYEERTATSRALQRSLLPHELPAIEGIEIGVAYDAAGSGNEVGGDFYDVFPVRSDRFAFAVGDVCGKGPEAAAVTGLARHALRLLAKRGDSMQDVLAALNAALLDEGERAKFVTVVYGEGRRRPGGGVELQLACAGHPVPLILRSDGTVEAAGVMGDLLGVFDNPITDVSTVDLRPGDALVCFTDGVTERRQDGRMLGEEGVAAVLESAAGVPAAALARRLQTAVTDFAETPPRDDLAILVLTAT
ncbi:MAG: hypothetical protein QOJ60_965 [Actinomycetota bacterium]|nr:hypothetical protein [Actinomycetota bacterium]